MSSLINFVSLVNKEKFHISVFAITPSGPNKKFIEEYCTIIGNKDEKTDNKKVSVKSQARNIVLSSVKAIKKVFERVGVDISPMLFKRYAKRLDKGNYDFVLAFQEGQATLFGSFFKHGTKIAWVRCEYTRYIKGEGSKYNTCYEKYDKIVSVSKAALSSFLSVLPQHSDRAYVQYNFLNDRRILDLSRETVNDLWDNNLFTIVSLGRIDPVKRVSEIPRLCKELKDSGLLFRWVIIGGVAVKEEYERLVDNIENYSVQGDVLLLGNRPNPYPYLKNSNLLVSLSTSETFNNTLTEAKILGVPVVTTDYPCAYESIDNKREGIISSFEDVATAIADMINDNSHLYSTIKDNLSPFKYDKDSLLRHLYANVLC